jgi:prefoldin alpha subunit
MADEEDQIKITNQQELQQSILYLEFIKEQLTTLNEQLEILELAIKEHNQAIDTLNDFKNLNKNDEILIPIGADSLVFAKIADPSKVILNIGVGLAKEEKLKDAVGKLTTRIEKIEGNKNKIRETIQGLTDQATTLSTTIEEKYKEFQESDLTEKI